MPLADMLFPADRVRSPLWLLLLPGIWSAALITAAVAQPWLPLPLTLRDVQAVMLHVDNENHMHLAGFVSNFGIMTWSVAFGVSGFAAVAVAGRRHAALLAALSVFSLVLALDDFFIIHERLAPFILGVPERLIFAVYFLTAAAILVIFFREIRGMAGDLLVIAVLGFGISMLVDVIYGTNKVAFEDIPKTFGISYWCAFCCRLSWLALKAGLR